MALTAQQVEDNLNILFDPGVCSTDDDRILISALAFQHLVLHFIHVQAPAFRGLVRFDNTKLGMMFRRFYRDINGVANLDSKIKKWIESKGMDKETAKELRKEIKILGIRINSKSPKKTRIAAAFSLWMSTFRPILLTSLPAIHKERAWRLDATINFWIAASFLSSFGDIKIGNPEKDPTDYRKRINRIWYDFTFRDLNLSSLEFMFAFVFVPDPALIDDETVDEGTDD